MDSAHALTSIRFNRMFEFDKVKELGVPMTESLLTSIFYDKNNQSRIYSNLKSFIFKTAPCMEFISGTLCY